MRKTLFLNCLSAFAGVIALAGGPLYAQEALSLMFGDPAGKHATVVFSPDKAAADAITISTLRVGVAGSRFSLSVDRSTTDLVTRILADEDCKFNDGGSVCSFAIPGGTPEYAALVAAFKRGLKVHVEVENAGNMEMSQDISLIGFTKAYGKL